MILFAPGAGAPSTSEWMRAWAGKLASIGDVEPFDYAYAKAGRKAPDRLPKLVEAHRSALAEARARHPRAPILLAGKSMGSRVGCHVSLEEPDVRALICFGYPLVGANGKVRDEVLLALSKPILFVQGTKDAMCPLDHLAEVRARMQAPNELFVVDGGDHSLDVRRGQADVDARILDAVRAFVSARIAP